MTPEDSPHVIVIGAGFCGLAAAYELAKQGVPVTVFESDSDVGGLAGSFEVNGTRLEKFYHHWFTNDVHVTQLIQELGLQDRILLRPTQTGVYYSNNFFKLSTPFDLLQFSPLSFFERIRLGVFTLRAQRIRDWRTLENQTAAEWIRTLGGPRIYEVVWEPLLRGKFGEVADEVSAVWFWNKIKLRGGSRGKGGGEQLAYFRGGFAALADALRDAIKDQGGKVLTRQSVDQLDVRNGRIIGVVCDGVRYRAKAVIATPALPLVADLAEQVTSQEYVDQLRRIRYLANTCVVLQLDRSLSSTYWTNVNDPGFPFVGVIEHTNFEPTKTYGGRHIVYLSKYLPENDTLYQMADSEAVEFTMSHLKIMFPEFDESWVIQSNVWRARFSQPIVEKNYGQIIPQTETPISGFYLATMAQIYPEDRGTNYAIQQGRQVGQLVAQKFFESTVVSSNETESFV